VKPCKSGYSIKTRNAKSCGIRIVERYRTKKTSDATALIAQLSLVRISIFLNFYAVDQPCLDLSQRARQGMDLSGDVVCVGVLLCDQGG
jgi:hypothetical protein